MKFLLTGANGHLGLCFKDIFPTDWSLLATNREQLDITDISDVDDCISVYKPDVIVNAAAYTSVDKTENESDLAYLVNVVRPKNLAIIAKKYQSKLILVSTDYVFDGTQKMLYVESDRTNSINVYGKTKREGEIAVIDNNSSAILIRTSWVFSEYGSNFVKTMLNLGSQKTELSIVDDQIGNSTYAGDLAKVMIELIKINANSGIYHYCGNKSTSWYLFAKQIFDIALKEGLLSKLPKIIPIDTQSFPTKARRPQYSVLSVNKMNKLNLFGSNWYEKLIFCISKIKSY